jgi:hypothetical protein
MQRIVHKNGRRIGGKDQAELSCIFVDVLYGKFFFSSPSPANHFDSKGFFVHLLLEGVCYSPKNEL